MKILLWLGLCILLSTVVIAVNIEEQYFISFSYTQEGLIIHNITKDYDVPYEDTFSEGLIFQIIDINNKTYNTTFPIDFYDEYTLGIPYNSRGVELRVYDGETLLASKSLTTLTEYCGNNKCDLSESSFSCSKDCKITSEEKALLTTTDIVKESNLTRWIIIGILTLIIAGIIAIVIARRKQQTSNL
jgi:hypothetical protein